MHSRALFEVSADVRLLSVAKGVWGSWSRHSTCFASELQETISPSRRIVRMDELITRGHEGGRLAPHGLINLSHSSTPLFSFH